MNVPPDDGPVRLRWGIYLLLFAIATGGMVGRILAVNAVDYARLEQQLKRQGRADWQKQRPFLSANDRSRWATIRALVEHGTYAIDDVVSQPNWDTIDMVKHDELGREAPEPDAGHLYSSKPPLFSTLLAGEYWVIHKLTGRTLGTHPYEIGRFMIITVNVLPLLAYFIFWAKIAERYGATDWGRICTVACACLGTFLTTFAVTINNHLPAAVTAVVTLYAALRITVDGRREARYFAVAGLFAALTAANELPALALVALVSLLLLWFAPGRTMWAFAPPALLVGAAALATNYAAHHTWTPPYAHRQEGDNWYDYRYLRDGKVRESYWSNREARSPIDQGEPSHARYAWHMLAGHHGIFSLTPIWLLSAVGLATLCRGDDPRLRTWGWLIATLSAVCILFYIFRPLDDRNYGGMTSGFRWVFWLAPLWLLAMLPAADAAARRWSTQIVVAVLLALSVLSASYPTWNPWTQPWLWDALEHFG